MWNCIISNQSGLAWRQQQLNTSNNTEFKESLRSKYVGYWIYQKQYKSTKDYNHRMDW